MKVSIFTPTHDPSFLGEVYDSIKAQPFYEWIVLLNNGATYSNEDPRVKIIRDDSGSDYVGYLKWRACQNACGDVLLELDHDDLLMPDAVTETQKAFDQHPEVGFAYSNTIHSLKEFRIPQRFPESLGFQYRAADYRGHALNECVAFKPSPSSVSRIWYAPDHLRAFRKDCYNKVGGHNRRMRVLDDQDLMCRMYLESQFSHIDRGLYIYRIHGENTWLKNNSEIQGNVLRIHDQYIERMAAKWSEDRGLRKLELGGRFSPAPGFETVDLKECDIVADLNERWPFEDATVGAVRAYDIFEHLPDPLHTMKELYRVMAPGAYAFIQVPSSEGRGAFQDPTHKSFWNENSFLYYTDRGWAQYIDTPVRFQAMRLYTTEKNSIGVCWARAHLVKLADGLRIPGEIKI